MDAITNFQKWLELGKQMGLEGSELNSFASAQQTLEREERCLLYTSDAADEMSEV